MKEKVFYSEYESRAGVLNNHSVEMVDLHRAQDEDLNVLRVINSTIAHLSNTKVSADFNQNVFTAERTREFTIKRLDKVFNYLKEKYEISYNTKID